MVNDGGGVFNPDRITRSAASSVWDDVCGATCNGPASVGATAFSTTPPEAKVASPA